MNYKKETLDDDQAMNRYGNHGQINFKISIGIIVVLIIIFLAALTDGLIMFYGFFIGLILILVLVLNSIIGIIVNVVKRKVRKDAVKLLVFHFVILIGSTIIMSMGFNGIYAAHRGM